MQDTLLLSNSYDVVGIINWKKAITLLTLNKVEIIESYDKEIRSSYLVLKMPSVVRLLKSLRKKPTKVNFSRINIYVRDNYKCCYCGSRKDFKELTFDHVVPKSQGGKTCWENIVTCCSPCNSKKANRTPQQAKMSLNKDPVKPTWLPGVVIKVNKNSLPSAWLDYLYWTGVLESESD